MLLKQHSLGCLAHASYLIADTATGTAVVVGPQRNIDLYLQDASQHGRQIRHVFLTHFYADFLANHLELRDRVGAAICLLHDIHSVTNATQAVTVSLHVYGKRLNYTGREDTS